MAGIGAVILLCFRCTGDIHIEESVFLIQQLEALSVQVRIRLRRRHHVAHTADEAGADEEAAGPAYGQGDGQGQRAETAFRIIGFPVFFVISQLFSHAPGISRKGSGIITLLRAGRNFSSSAGMPFASVIRSFMALSVAM